MVTSFFSILQYECLLLWNFGLPNKISIYEYLTRVQASKKPYNAFLRLSAGLGSWSQFKTNVAIFSS
jgi:hypothetical protein